MRCHSWNVLKQLLLLFKQSRTRHFVHDIVGFPVQPGKRQRPLLVVVGQWFTPSCRTMAGGGPTDKVRGAVDYSSS